MEQLQINQKDILVEELNKKLQENEITYFSILDSNVKKSNFYVENNYKIESILKAQREEKIVKIRKTNEDNTFENVFTISIEDDLNKIQEEINDAIFICSESKNKSFLDVDSDNILVDDSEINYDDFIDKKLKSDFQNNTISLFIEEKLNLFKEIIENSQEEDIKIKLNALELFTTISKKSLQTSTNISKEYEKDSAYLEFVLTAKDSNSKESEHIIYQKINSLYNFNFEDFFKETILTLKDTIKSQKPFNFKGKVVLKSTATVDFFRPDQGMNAFIAHSSAKFKYDKISNYELNQEIINSQKDKLTIYSNPLLKQNLASTPFDMDGVTSKKVCLIENNILKNFFASNQYAQYLNIGITGSVGAIEIQSGSYIENEDLDERIEIHTFSSFVPDIVSGNFSAEIRLGYHIKDGIKTPFKGGLFSGNIFKLLENCKLSTQIIEESGYKGPKSIKFYDGEIIGL